MRSIDEFSYSDEPGKIQQKPNRMEQPEHPLVSIVTPFYNAERDFMQTY